MIVSHAQAWGTIRVAEAEVAVDRRPWYPLTMQDHATAHLGEANAISVVSPSLRGLTPTHFAHAVQIHLQTNSLTPDPYNLTTRRWGSHLLTLLTRTQKQLGI